MFIVNQAVLTCPECGFKHSITMPETGYISSFECPNCSKSIQVSESACCVICEFSDMYCLQKQRSGSCSW